MTLHWWMHWFWVTANIAMILGAPLTTEESYYNRERRPMFVTKTPSQPSQSPTEIKISISNVQPLILNNNNNNSFNINNNRNAKAITLPSNESKNNNLAGPDNQEQSLLTSIKRNNHQKFDNNYHLLPELRERESKIAGIEEIKRSDDYVEKLQDNNNSERIRATTESDILWTTTANHSVRRKKTKKTQWNLSSNNGDIEVLPLRLATEVKVVVNTSTIDNNGDTISVSRQTVNRSEDFVFVQSSVSAAPILEASIEKISGDDVIESNRAEDRSFVVDSLNKLDDIDDSIHGESELVGNYVRDGRFTSLDIAAIAGSCFVMIVLISTMASFGFMMYRRKYLNPPQTLNSDKCSNPDSSGYIDDSTIRDNSEEMYSLDNDSFLNSLEAMTIQNFWTDSVKHTKL